MSHKGTLRTKCLNERTNFDDIIGFCKFCNYFITRMVRVYLFEIPSKQA